MSGSSRHVNSNGRLSGDGNLMMVVAMKAVLLGARTLLDKESHLILIITL